MRPEFGAFRNSLEALAQVALRAKGEQSVTRPRLDRIAAAVQAIRTAAAEHRYAHLVERLADLEAQLMDSKIADRVRGYLEDETDSDPTEAIVRHVETVLRPTRTRIMLEQALSELEEEIEERRIVGRAKRIMQARDSVSEEQAYIELRLRSRKSRKPLKDVARQVIENRQLVKGTGA
jgi:AmiR/NasT family two-component response regulator